MEISKPMLMESTVFIIGTENDIPSDVSSLVVWEGYFCLGEGGSCPHDSDVHNPLSHIPVLLHGLHLGEEVCLLLLMGCRHGLRGVEGVGGWGSK